MYVCICNAVTDRQIREAAERGTTRLSQLRKECGVPGDCGRCARHAHELLREARAARREPDFAESALPSAVTLAFA